MVQICLIVWHRPLVWLLAAIDFDKSKQGGNIIISDRYGGSLGLADVPGISEAVVFNCEGVGVDLVTVREQVAAILLKLILEVPDVLCPPHAAILLWVLSYLGRVQRFVGHQQEVRIVLLLPHNQLSEIDWASNCECVVVVDAHTVDVAEVSDAPEIGQLGHVGEEAHALQPAVASALIHCYCQLVPQELLELRPQQIHPRVLPEPPIVMQQLMPQDISHNCQFVVGTPLVELQQRLHYIIGQREALSGDVLVAPQLDLEVGMHLLSLLVEVLLRGRQLTPQPHLMNHSRDQLRARLLIHRDKGISWVESEELGNRHLEFQRVEGHVVHVGELEASAGTLQLHPVDGLKCVCAQEGSAGECSEGVGDVKFQSILFAKVVQTGKVEVCKHHLDQTHQKDDAVSEVPPVVVPQVELGNKPETLNRNHPEMVENGLHFGNVRVHDALVLPTHLHGLRYHQLAISLYSNIGSDYVSWLHCLCNGFQSVRAVELVSEVQQHCVSLGVAVFGTGLLDVVHLC